MRCEKIANQQFCWWKMEDGKRENQQHEAKIDAKFSPYFLKTFCTKLVKQYFLPLVVGNQMCALQENNIVARANCGSFRDQLIISTIKNGVTFVFMWFISATSFWSWSLLSKSKASVSSIDFLSTFCIHQSHCITCYFF